jgi:hypothetical protein
VTRRALREFTDARGRPVRVGDRVESTLMEGYAGRVAFLDRDRAHKPYVVRADDGSIFYSNREYVVLREAP